MKRLSATTFFCLLQGEDVIVSQVLRAAYDEFASLLFAMDVAGSEVSYLNTLVYTRVELATLKDLSQKKYGGSSLYGASRTPTGYAD
jgi:hypothetical protein